MQRTIWKYWWYPIGKPCLTTISPLTKTSSLNELTALSRLPTLERGIVIIPMTTLMHRTPPQHYVASNVLTLTEGQALNTRQLVTNLSLSGYRAVDTVMEHGEYATRGSLIDLYRW